MEHQESKKQKLSNRTLAILTWLVGILTFLLGLGWIIYDFEINAEVSYFAIPLIMTTPVIAAVAFRNLFE